MRDLTFLQTAAIMSNCELAGPLVLAAFSTSSRGRTAAAKIGKDHDYQMSGEPNIVVAHILIDVYQDKYARSKGAEQQIGPLRNGVWREQIRIQKQENEHHDPRKEE